MKREDARLLASRGGLLLVALWALSLGLVFLFPLALPSGKGGAFFSFAGLEPERAIDWLDLYIPANPFRSLANNVVPAVVVFAVLAGVGLMALPRKQALLEPLHVFNEAMGRVGEPARPADPARHLRDRGEHRRHHAARGVRAAAGVRAHLRRLRLPADLLAAARARGRADAGQPQADDRARAGRARHRVRHVQPLHRAPHPRGALAHAPRRAAGEGRRDGRGARERARGRARPDVLQLPARREGALDRLRAVRRVVRRGRDPGRALPGARGRRPPRGLREHQHGDPVPARPRARAGRPLPALRGLGRRQQPLRRDDLGHAHAGGGRPRHLPRHRPHRAAAGTPRALPRAERAARGRRRPRHPGAARPHPARAREGAPSCSGASPPVRRSPP